MITSRILYSFVIG